ncbi:MAG: cobaltochelatase subunit CobN [Pseudomonadota bacterium]
MSPRNTADVLSGAHQFLDGFSNHQVAVRTTDQFLDLEEKEQQILFNQADIVFAGGVYGETAALLRKYLENSEFQNLSSFVAVHSDRALVKSSRITMKPMLLNADLDELMKDPPAEAGKDIQAWSSSRLATFSEHKNWLLAKTFWADRETDNIDGLLRHLIRLLGNEIRVPTPVLKSPLRVRIDGKTVSPESLDLSGNDRWVAIVDYETGGRPGEVDLIRQLCEKIENQSNLKCLTILAKWGQATVSASDLLVQHKDKLAVVISLQNFVLGGGEGRAEVNENLAALNVPVLKGLRLADSTALEYTVSEEGLRWDSVHYRVAMPEVQGISQPLVLAAMTPPTIDIRTGANLALSQPIAEQVSLMANRVIRWHTLQTKSNRDKRLAVIYYNHPPGRHNIGADNLNVPNSLFGILKELQAAGYNTGDLPESAEALLDMLQDRGVNLPENRGELADMAAKVQLVSAAKYQEWFDQLPKLIQDEMQNGPLGYLQSMLQTAVKLDDPEVAKKLVRRVLEDLKHAMEGADHKARDRVLDLLDQLKTVYEYTDTNDEIDWKKSRQLVDAISASGIEGIRGWGVPPGKVMIHEGNLLLPGLRFGNVFVGPQPPRGWELNEEILHANLSFPPTHQYLAYYQWLRNEFKADALVHLGRHSTYEFLPRHRVGMNDTDYPTALIGDLPSVYPYIVDGVGEGIQAKRRGLAVIVDHLTPPLESTELYDKLLELRQLVESYEAAPEAAGAMRSRAIVAIKNLVDELKLADELTKSMEGELEIRGVKAYDEVDDELLVHEVGHYLTKMQEDFMPLGLHSFGQEWTKEAVATMLSSITQGEEQATEETIQSWQVKLSSSPAAEMRSLINGLDGGYVSPGKGNDPIRTPEVLPTGRNFYALDGGLIPSRLGYQVGVELAAKARAVTSPDEADAVVLWASDVVRDEGAMIAFGFDMLGVKPIWSSRGIVKRLERLDVASMTENNQPRIRRDTVYTTSGLFRDLYGAHIVWLERAVLMALDASSDLIRQDFPALSLALNAALTPLGEQQNPGKDSLKINYVAAQWIKDTRAAMQNGIAPELAGRTATYRLFGDAPGTYGAGVNRLVERSGAWEKRSEVADVYIRRIGHAYGSAVHGEPVQALFRQRLNTIGNTYLGRSSNLYGLLDNNDTFDYLGGLSLAVETVKGSVPDNFILAHENNANISVEPLDTALLSELRGRFLNPQWLEPLMEEGYAGARTMGSEFFEYLWGWQVTNPDVVKSWVWDEVKSVYIDDRHDIGLDTFLEENHNVHVKSNMLSVMLVAAQKQFWDADQATLEEISNLFAELIIENGLPGSGHNSPDSPIFKFIDNYLNASQRAGIEAVLDAAKITQTAQPTVSTISELTTETSATQNQGTDQASHEERQNGDPFESMDYRWLLALLVFLMVIGVIFGARAPRSKRS